MKNFFVFLLTTFTLVACQTPPTHTPVPSLDKSIDVVGSLSASAANAAQDSKTVKAAIGELQKSNDKLRGLSSRQRELLDTMDYKTTKLLGK